MLSLLRFSWYNTPKPLFGLHLYTDNVWNIQHFHVSRYIFTRIVPKYKDSMNIFSLRSQCSPILIIHAWQLSLGRYSKQSCLMYMYVLNKLFDLEMYQEIPFYFGNFKFCIQREPAVTARDSRIVEIVVAAQRTQTHTRWLSDRTTAAQKFDLFGLRSAFMRPFVGFGLFSTIFSELTTRTYCASSGYNLLSGVQGCQPVHSGLFHHLLIIRSIKKDRLWPSL